MIKWITQLDFSVLYWIQDSLKCVFFDFLMPKITALGNAGLIWLLSAGIMIMIPKYRRTGILLLAGLAVGFLVGNVIMKPLFARPRPCHVDTAVHLLVSMPNDFSFPSGHTLSSVIGATVLTFTYHRLAYVAIPTAAMIAFSRLYLFVHFPTDVLVSVILGVTIGAAVWKSGGILWDTVLSASHNRKS